MQNSFFFYLAQTLLLVIAVAVERESELAASLQWKPVRRSPVDAIVCSEYGIGNTILNYELSLPDNATLAKGKIITDNKPLR